MLLLVWKFVPCFAFIKHKAIRSPEMVPSTSGDGKSLSVLKLKDFLILSPEKQHQFRDDRNRSTALNFWLVCHLLRLLAAKCGITSARPRLTVALFRGRFFARLMRKRSPSCFFQANATCSSHVTWDGPPRKWRWVERKTVSQNQGTVKRLTAPPWTEAPGTRPVHEMAVFATRTRSVGGCEPDLILYLTSYKQCWKKSISSR